jgi:hypothetical protein
MMWRDVDPNRLRWSKDRKPTAGAVTIGSTVRAEIVGPPTEPTSFRVWRTRSLLSGLFTRFTKPRPLLLQVGGWDGHVVYSEEFGTGSHADWKSRRYEFDPGEEKPRSSELEVVPQATFKRQRGWHALSSTELALSSQFVPAKAGTKLDLGAGGSVEENYVVTAAIDPRFEARVLMPWAGGDTNLVEHIIDLLSRDAAEIYSASPEEFRQQAYQFIQAVVPEGADASADVEVKGPHAFSLGEGEQSLLSVAIHARRPGIGLFAIQLVDTDGLASTADPCLLVVSGDLATVALYDAVIKGYESDADPGTEALERRAMARDRLPIPGEPFDIEVVVARPDDEGVKA